jgi:hypothetical protein
VDDERRQGCTKLNLPTYRECSARSFIHERPRDLRELNCRSPLTAGQSQSHGGFSQHFFGLPSENIQKRENQPEENIDHI